MSAIYFHSQKMHENGQACAVRGNERAYAGGLASSLLGVSLQLSRYDMSGDPLLDMCSGEYIKRIDKSRVYEDVLTWLNVSSGYFNYRGKQVPTFDCALNTTIMLGNDAIKLLARLHGQCEIYTYVEEPNRYWLADIIITGLEQNILRENMGWDAVITILRDIVAQPGAIVTSYSICDQFPNPYISGNLVGEEEEKKWYKLSEAEQWQTSMDVLRNIPLMEMKPENWNTFLFGDGITGFDIRAEANRMYNEQR